MERKKLELHQLKELKKGGEPLTMLTAYDYPTAKMLDEEGIDLILVGDSVANVVLGYNDTRPVTMEEMLHHTKAVVRGVNYGLVIGDMPFMSYNVTREEAVRNAGRFIKETGCDMVKLEGAGSHGKTISSIVGAGIPVCGHIGLTPQTAGLIGGYRVQGRSSKAAVRIIHDALTIELAGASLLVIECVPTELAHEITTRLSIPVIGIGAGESCDGQVLVFHDMLGIQTDFAPRFVKRYMDAEKLFREAVQAYRTDVKGRTFPTADHSFAMPEKSYEKLKNILGRECDINAESESVITSTEHPEVRRDVEDEAKSLVEKARLETTVKSARKELDSISEEAETKVKGSKVKGSKVKPAKQKPLKKRMGKKKKE